MDGFLEAYAIVSTVTVAILIGAYVRRNQMHDPVSPGAIWAFNFVAFTLAMVSVSGVSVVALRALSWVV